MINIDVRAWIVGGIVTFTSALGFLIGERVMNPLIAFANANSMDPTAYDVMNLIVGVWRPVMVLMAVAGLVYIIYSSIPTEGERQYGGLY